MTIKKTKKLAEILGLLIDHHTNTQSVPFWKEQLKSRFQAEIRQQASQMCKIFPETTSHRIAVADYPCKFSRYTCFTQQTSTQQCAIFPKLLISARYFKSSLKPKYFFNNPLKRYHEF